QDHERSFGKAEEAAADRDERRKRSLRPHEASEGPAALAPPPVEGQVHGEDHSRGRPTPRDLPRKGADGYREAGREQKIEEGKGVLRQLEEAPGVASLVGPGIPN